MTETCPPRQIPVGRRLLDVLDVAYRARLPVLLEGRSGIGKSEIFEQLGRKLGIEVIVIDLPVLEPPDLVGIPTAVDGRTVYARPERLPTDGAGIMLLEELGRCDRPMRQATYQLLSHRELAGYRLPDDWCVMAATNPEGAYDVNHLDEALRTRFMDLKVCAERGEWLLWAERNDVHPVVIALARRHDRVFESVSPRSWTKASQALYAVDPLRLDDEEHLRDVLSGYLPHAWVSALIQELARSGADIGLDVHVALRSYRKSGAQSIVRGFRDNGETDRLDELSLRLRRAVEGAELGALIGREEFDLISFEQILADLPGDQRELIQETFARNPLSVQLLSLGPDELIERYQTRGVSKTFAGWLAKDEHRHRAWAAAWAVPDRLGKREDLVELRHNNAVKSNLSKLIADLGPTRAVPLVEGLRNIDFRPVIPTPAA
jgi:MoxR-like ATPase